MPRFAGQKKLLIICDSVTEKAKCGKMRQVKAVNGALVNKNWTRKSNNWTVKMICGTGLAKDCASGPPPLDRT